MRRGLLCVLLCAFSVCAFWENQTAAIRGPRISVVNSKGVERLYVQISANTPINLPVKKRTSVMWTISSDTSGVVRVFRSLGPKDSAIVVQNVVRGTTDLRLFCEPDNYRLVSSVPVRARYFVWQNPRTTPLVPVGGGYPVYLQAKDNSTVPYYHVSKDTAAVLKVKGPAFAYVYVRSYAPVGGRTVNLEFEMRRGTALVVHKVIQSVPSAEAAFVKPVVGYVPSKATLVKVKVPAGIHEYSVSTLNDRALVKFFYKTVAARVAAKTKIPVLGRARGGSKGRLASGSTGLFGRAPARRNADLRSILSTTVAAGLVYDNNVYTYGDDKVDGYPPDSAHEYRYPGVGSLDDWVWPLDLRVVYRLGPMRLRGALGAEVYTRNRQLNTCDFSLALGWTGPALVEFCYTYVPFRPVRPTYSEAAGRYAMLEYRSQRGEAKLRVNNRWHPELSVACGMYDYEAPFDYLNAVYFGGEFGIKRSRVLGVLRDNMITWSASAGLGDVVAVKEAELDRSNLYFSVNAGTSLDVRFLTFGLRGSVLPRFYSTASDSDAYKDRRDLEFGCTPYVQYFIGGLTITADIFEIDGRKVWAADPADETSKSYLALRGGLHVSFNVKPLERLPTGRG